MSKTFGRKAPLGIDGPAERGQPMPRRSVATRIGALTQAICRT
jgi:hypothetical protein